MVEGNVKISAIEYCLGERKETGLDLKKDNPDWRVEDIEKKTGITTRWIAPDGTTAVDLACNACEKIFNKIKKIGDYTDLLNEDVDVQRNGVLYFYSEDYNDEAFVRDFYEQIQELLNADISEIRIYAPINTDVLKNQVTAARGTLSSLNMLRKLGFPLDKVVFIEGQGSVYKFSKDVRGTKLVAVREKTPELLILITDVCEIEKSMNNVIQKGGLTHDEIMSKYEASRSGDTVIAPLKENLLEQTVNPVIWELANKAVERYLKNGKDKQDDPLKNIPGNISGGYSGVTQYRKAVKHILSKLGI